MSQQQGSDQQPKRFWKSPLGVALAGALVAGVFALLAEWTDPFGSNDQTTDGRATTTVGLTSTSVPPTSTTPTTQSRDGICNGTVEALEDETAAIDRALAEVVTQGEGEDQRPIRVTARYPDAVNGVRQTSRTLRSALGAFTAAGLDLPPDDDVRQIVSDVDAIFGRLPGELAAKQDTADDWGALPDRRNYLNELASTIGKQCTRVATTSS